MVHFVDTTSNAPTVSHVISGDAGVTGVTSLGDDVFVVRYEIQQVEVYDAVTFTLQRCLSVPGLGRYSSGLAACASNKCLYASEINKDCVHRVELSGSNAVTKWSVGRGPAGLTVNSAKNVLVVIKVNSSYWSSRLTELYYRPFSSSQILRFRDKLSNCPVASL